MMHMLMFHVRSVLRTTYFVQLMVTSTVSILTLQLLAVHATGASGDSAWLRAGLVGAWTINTVSAGIVGFNDSKGHLRIYRSPLGRPVRSFCHLLQDRLPSDSAHSQSRPWPVLSWG